MPIADILAAIEGERQALLAPIEAKLAILDEMERLANELLDDAPASVLPRALLPARPPATRQGRDGLPPKTQSVLEVLRASGQQMSAGEVAEQMQTTPATLRKHLQQLVERGLVDAHGQTAARRYQAANPDNAMSGGSERAASPAAPAPRRSPSAPSATLSELRVARSRILDHLGRRRLDEPSIATGLNLDAAVVADVCAPLLADGLIVRLPDGRYEHADGITR